MYTVACDAKCTFFAHGTTAGADILRDLTSRLGMGESTFTVGEYLEADDDDEVDEDEVDEGAKEAPEDPCVNPWAVGGCAYRASG